MRRKWLCEASGVEACHWIYPGNVVLLVCEATD